MRIFILATALFFTFLPLPSKAIASKNTDIECTVIDGTLWNNKITNKNQFANQKVEPSDYFGVPKRDNKFIFSINTPTKKASILSGIETYFIEWDTAATTIEIQPDSFVIRTYYRSEPLNPKNQDTALDTIYQINRLSGKLFIQKYSPDASWEPYYKIGDKMWVANGLCKQLDSKF